MTIYCADEVAAYARCSMEWYWRYTAKQMPPPAPRDLQASLLRQATRLYYEGQAPSLVQGVGLVLRDWCEAWQVVSMYDSLQEYIAKQIAILTKFSQGQIRKPDGKLFFAPRMSNRYRDLMHAQGMTDLARRLNAFAQQVGVLLPEDYGEGSAFGDALADAVRGAELADRAVDGYPAREAVLGVQVPFVVPADDATQITGLADLVLSLPDEERIRFEGNAVALEIHDFGERSLRADAAARSLPVIIAGLSRSMPESSPVWDIVAKVIYRHVPSGKTLTFRRLGTGRFTSVVSAVTRGIRTGVVVPRLLTSPQFCTECGCRRDCFNGSGDVFDVMDPTVALHAQRLLTVAQTVREHVRSSTQASALLDVLDQITHTMEANAPDAQTMHHIMTVAADSARDALSSAVT